MFRKKARYEEMPNDKAGVRNACGLLGFMLLLWYVAGESGLLNPAMLPRIQEVGWSFWQLLYPPADETLFSNAQIFRYFDFIDNFEATFIRVALGCAIGIPLGLILGATAAASSRLGSLLSFIAWIFYSLPNLLLLIPAALLGVVGSKGAICVGALAAFSITFITMHASMSSVGLQNLIDEGRVLGLRRWQILLLVTLPNPDVVKAFSTSLVLAVKTSAGGVVVAELFSTSSGLGALFKVALTNGRLPELIAIGVCLMVLIAGGPLLGGMYFVSSRFIWKGVQAVCRVLLLPVKNTPPS